MTASGHFVHVSLLHFSTTQRTHNSSWHSYALNQNLREWPDFSQPTAPCPEALAASALSLAFQPHLFFASTAHASFQPPHQRRGPYAKLIAIFSRAGHSQCLFPSRVSAFSFVMFEVKYSDCDFAYITERVCLRVLPSWLGVTELFHNKNTLTQHFAQASTVSICQTKNSGRMAILNGIVSS